MGRKNLILSDESESEVGEKHFNKIDEEPEKAKIQRQATNEAKGNGDVDVIRLSQSSLPEDSWDFK